MLLVPAVLPTAAQDDDNDDAVLATALLTGDSIDGDLLTGAGSCFTSTCGAAALLLVVDEFLNGNPGGGCTVL